MGSHTLFSVSFVAPGFFAIVLFYAQWTCLILFSRPKECQAVKDTLSSYIYITDYKQQILKYNESLSGISEPLSKACASRYLRQWCSFFGGRRHVGSIICIAFSRFPREFWWQRNSKSFLSLYMLQVNETYELVFRFKLRFRFIILAAHLLYFGFMNRERIILCPLWPRNSPFSSASVLGQTGQARQVILHNVFKFK